MKKQIAKRPLVLHKETVQQLTAPVLGQIIGGKPPATWHTCVTADISC